MLNMNIIIIISVLPLLPLNWRDTNIPTPTPLIMIDLEIDAETTFCLEVFLGLFQLTNFRLHIFQLTIILILANNIVEKKIVRVVKFATSLSEEIKNNNPKSNVTTNTPKMVAPVSNLLIVVLDALIAVALSIYAVILSFPMLTHSPP